MSALLEFLITLVLGWLGVHKFIKGNYIMGLVYLFTLGLFGIGWLYDTIRAGLRYLNSLDAARVAQQVVNPSPGYVLSPPPQFTDAQREQTEAAIAAIPRATVRVEDRHLHLRPVSDIQGLSYSTITRRSDMVKMGRFVVLDVETTGLQVTKSEIIEVAAIRFVDFEPVEAFTTLIQPHFAIPTAASDINGITNDMVNGCPSFHSILASMQEFIANYNLVAHNAKFDLSILYRWGLDFMDGRRLYDTLYLSQSINVRGRDVADYKLATMCAHYGICPGTMHRALADAYCTGLLFAALASAKHAGQP